MVEVTTELKRDTKKDEKKVITLRHPKLFNSLYMSMLIYGTTGPFRLNASRERNIRRLKLRLQEGKRVYTNFQTIFLGEDFEYFNGDINHDFQITKTLIGHEIGHIRFTNKTDYMGAIYSSGHRFGSYVKPMVSDLMNILEDSRIEYLMGKLSSRLGRGFYYLNNLIIKDMDKDEIFKKEIHSDQERLQLFANVVLYTALKKRLPDIKDLGLRLLAKRSYKYILYAQRARTTKDVVLVMNKLLLFAKPMIKNLTKKLEEIMSERHEVGTHSPIEGDELSSVIPRDSIFSEEERGKISEELAKTPGSDEESDDSDTGEIKREEITGQNTFEHLDEEVELLEEKIKTEGGLTDEYLKNIQDEMFEPITEALVNDYFSDEGKKTARERRDIKIEKETRENIEPELAHPELHVNCIPHFVDKNDLKYFDPIEYENIKRQMIKYIREGAKNIKSIKEQYELTTLSMQKRGVLNRRRLINAAAFGDTNVFDRNQQEIKEMEMDVMILVDVSGSNNAAVPNNINETILPRFRLNQMATIVAHEIMKEARIKHTVWTFDELFKVREDGKLIERFIPVIDYNNSLNKNAGLPIASIQALDNNRDGYSLAYAGEFFRRISKSEKKLLIVISDGAPAARGYGGPSAVHDSSLSVKKLEDKGVKVFGIFTGSENENKHFESIYTNKMTFNNESAHELPENLKNLIVREFKDMLI